MVRAESEPASRSAGCRRRDVYVVLRVLPDRDWRVVRYGAAVALVLALALFLVLLVAPESLAIGL